MRMCMYMCECVCVCARARARVRVYTCMCTCTCMCTSADVKPTHHHVDLGFDSQKLGKLSRITADLEAEYDHISDLEIKLDDTKVCPARI